MIDSPPDAASTTDPLPSPERFSFQVDSEQAGERLDRWVAERIPSLSRNQVQNEIKRGGVLINGEAKPARYRIRAGDRVEVEPTQAPTFELKPSSTPLDAVYEDDDLLVVHKPARMVVHPAPGHWKDTLANALLTHVGPEMAEVGGENRCGIVHRLDKLTSGLLIVAKNEASFEKLTAAVAAREVDRRYLGLVLGQFEKGEATIDRPIGRRASDRKRMGVIEGGREARTSFRVLLQSNRVSLLMIKLHTGRTHQIRVHLQSIGRPILGDPEYGWTKKHTLAFVDPKLRSQLGPHWPTRQMLHAAGLRFEHPTTGKTLEIRAPIPEDFRGLTELIFGEKSLEPEIPLFDEIVVDEGDENVLQ